MSDIDSITDKLCSLSDSDSGEESEVELRLLEQVADAPCRSRPPSLTSFGQQVSEHLRIRSSSSNGALPSSLSVTDGLLRYTLDRRFKDRPFSDQSDRSLLNAALGALLEQILALTPLADQSVAIFSEITSTGARLVN